MTKAKDLLSKMEEGKKGIITVTTELSWESVPSRGNKSGGFVGSLHTNLKSLTQSLGRSLPPSPDGKVRKEWIIRFGNDEVAWVYDYADDTPVSKITEWHVGGSRKAAEWIAKIVGAKFIANR